MLIRVFYFLLVIICCTSCTFLSSDKNKDTIQLDTIINFNKVDASPFFIECKELIDEAKTACFRTTIHRKLAENLSKQTIKAYDSIDEVITINLIINYKGRVILSEFKSSERVKKEIPTLDSLLQVSVDNLPTIYPAIKRGIPVNTQYSLPIRIQLKE